MNTISNEQIREIALANGFKLKEQPDGEMDLNPYVYDFARALLEQAHAVDEHSILSKIADHVAANINPDRGNSTGPYLHGYNHALKEKGDLMQDQPHAENMQVSPLSQGLQHIVIEQDVLP